MASIPQVKEYQTLFWVPMLFQTAASGEGVIDEMLDMITAFHDNDQTPLMRPSVIMKDAQNQRRQQILGDMADTEVVTTRIDVVPKSENTKYIILSVLKVGPTKQIKLMALS
jgi:transcriptional regulator GlxA family with amidase domain